MRPSFHANLINDPFDDPGLFIRFVFEKNAMLFDIGDIQTLSTRDVLKISHIFITHTHMDHFIGFDRLLRIFLGRTANLALFGPEGFLDNLEGKLAGYQWNLVNRFSNPLVLNATEVHANRLIQKTYPCGDGFKAGPATERPHLSQELIREPGFTISAVILDHRIPCLAFSLKERFHINIKKAALDSLALAPGPWLNDFKQALFNEKPMNSEFRFSSNGKTHIFQLGALADAITLITPGQKISYVVDVIGSPSNSHLITEFARNSDHLFIEAAFLHQHTHIAAEKYHLTARQAGHLAAASGSKRFSLLHHSPRYEDQGDLFFLEAEQAYKEYRNG